MEFKVFENIMAENENSANEIRDLLKEKNIMMINMISSAGSGKTTILEKSIPHLQKKYRIGIIEGDLETDRDAQRLKQFGMPMVLLNTKGMCHLNADSIRKALKNMPLDDLDIVFVENVGNLVCPAEFDIGEHHKVAVLSTPEGDDKILKYPLLFCESNLVLLNKIDLLKMLDFDKKNFYQDLSRVNGSAKVVEMSATNEIGLNHWISWVEQSVITSKECDGKNLQNN